VLGHASPAITERAYIDGERGFGCAAAGGRCSRAGINDGNRWARSGFHRPPGLAEARRRSPKNLDPVATYLSCEWPDSNRHGVTHWYLKPAEM
jgi:hypothetical protein